MWYDYYPNMYKQVSFDESTFNTTPPSDLLANYMSSHCLQWQNVTYQLPKRFDVNRFEFLAPKTLIANLSGQVSSGQLVAVLGPSGAGKTTLINCLSGRIAPNDLLTGEVTVRVDHERRTPIKMALVSQTNQLFKQFSVYETLLFAFKLKNGTNYTPRPTILNLLTDFSMIDTIDQQVSKLSGGQIKRLAICCELISSADILFLDEPTTGLDSSAASDLIGHLSELTIKYRTSIIASIHQPSNEIFFKFDQIYLLSNKGKLVFNGQPGSILDFFRQFGHECPKHRSIPDFTIDVVRRKFSLDHIDGKICSSPIAQLSDYESNEKLTLTQSMSQIVTQSNQSNSIVYESLMIAKRNFDLWNLRTPSLVIRLLANLLVVIMMYFVFETPPGREDGCVREEQWNSSLTTIESRQKFSYYIRDITNGGILSLSAVVHVCTMAILPTSLMFPIEFGTIRSEIGNNWYRPSSYFIGRTLADIPSIFIQLLPMSVVVYVICEMAAGYHRFAIFFASIVACQIIGETMATMSAICFMPNLYKVVLGSAIIVGANLVFTGFFIPAVDVPTLMAPLAELCFARYVFESIIISQYGLGRCEPMSANSGNSKDLYSLIVETNSPPSIIKRLIDEQLSKPSNFNTSQLINVPQKYLTNILNATIDYLESDSIDSNTKYSNSYDSNSYILQWLKISDQQLMRCFIYLILMIIVSKVTLYFILVRKIRSHR